MDTVATARQEREKNGPWEPEISYGGEADLHKHLDGCDKNPGHLQFVPVDLFNVDRLPSDCQDNDLVEMIRVMADLTVRVSVNYVSEKRPATFPGTDKPYPCFANRGSDMMRVGTGCVCFVEEKPIINRDDKRTCFCKECQNSPTPKEQLAHIHILTAAHVVFDDLEAAHTTCHLFFDRGGTPDSCDGAIVLSGMSDVKCRINDDWSWMVHTTHDFDLKNRLDKMLSHRYTLLEEVKERYDPIKFRPFTHNTMKMRPSSDPSQMFIIIVSHPHGCSKQVSFGRCTDVDENEFGLTQYTYNTATCPGSSGAPMCVMWKRMWNYAYSQVHCGNCEGDNQLNFSSWT